VKIPNDPTLGYRTLLKAFEGKLRDYDYKPPKSQPSKTQRVTSDGKKKHEGFLHAFEVSREDANQLIKLARIALGWIEADPEVEEELAEDEPAAEEAAAHPEA
jgi:hypothetical protein